MRRYDEVACAVDTVLLPRAGVDLGRWAVVACDQFTSQPECWRDVEELVGDAPSTLRLIYPEVYLGEPDGDRRIADIRRSMAAYLDGGVLERHEGLIYVERETGGRTRRGLVLCLDLERYDYAKGAASLIRATEGTIVSRLPPRVKIRCGAPLELPHIMVLVDDPADTVIGPVAARAGAGLTCVYDFELMRGAGHVTGYRVDDLALEASVMEALAALARPASFAARYGLGEGEHPVLLFAMGDGNHSLATAKAIWDATKAAATDPATVMASPSRWALVELVNVHDRSLDFEPIHRVLFDVVAGRDPVAELVGRAEWGCSVAEVASVDALREAVDRAPPGEQRIGVVRAGGLAVVTVANPPASLAVGTLQAFLDGFVAGHGARELDYVHDTDPVVSLGRRPGNVGFYLPAMSKGDLFRSVVLDGALPRKTFSMGESMDKRFYLECRALG
jgi:hypothetical protein